MVGGPAGVSYFIGSATGSYYNDAKERGMDDKQAGMYSTIMGIIEGSLESVGAKLTTNVGKSLLKKNIKGALIDYGLDVAENFLEEAFVEPISELVAQTTGGKDKANWKDIRKRFLKSGIDGAVTSLITGGVAGTIGGIASRSQNNQATKQNILPIKENVNEYRDYYTNKKVDSNTNKMLNEAQKLIDDNTSFNTPINSKFLETARNNNIDINSNDIQNINRVLRERNINGSFDAELFNNSSQSALWRKTKDSNGNMIREVVFNPNADTSKTIQNLTIHELIHDFEDSNSYNQLKDLVLSFDKTKTGYEEARKALVETYSKVYDKDAADFNELIDNEAVADILGNKLGDQEFINNLTMQDRTLGQKIYDWVVDKLNKINKLTGYKNEKLYWTDVKNKFENAFKQEFNNKNNSTKYSFAGRNAKNANVTKLAEAVKLEEQGMSAQEIYEKTGWYRGNETKWRFEIADNDFNIKDKTIKKDGWYRLEDILDAPELYEAYPELKRTEIYFEDFDGKGNGYSIAEKNKINIANELIRENDNPKDNELLGLKNQDKVYSTLMHEIQHLIQKTEGFSRGSSQDYWYKKGVKEATKYAESLPAFKQLKTAKEKAEFVESYIENNVDKLVTYSNYRNTAGEQEARNVQDRIRMSQKKRKSALPFVKNEETVYADDRGTNYHVSQNFSDEIDKVLNNQAESNTQIKARDYTPSILVKNGVKNLPMLITQKHIKSTIYTLQEAEKLKLPVKNINYHGLGKDLLIKAIDNLDNPKAIYKTNENNYLVVTEFKDNSGKEIVVPIQINGKGRYNNVFIDENQIKSVYGRNNLENYINNNNFKEIYTKKEELDFNEGVQYSNVANSSINNSIAPLNKNVNTTKYSMQESEKNSDSFSNDVKYSLSEDNQESRLAKLNEDFDLYDKTREALYERRDSTQKQYSEIFNSQEYKEAVEKVTKMANVNEATKTDEYQLLVKAQRLKKQINDYQDEIDIASQEMKRIAKEIDKEEQQHRNPKEAIKRAKKELGLTSNFKEAGYMLEDGSLLDFSGRSQGSNAYNQRTMDHREINEFGYEMSEFIELGNIRMQPESNGFELMKEPTQEQYNMLKKYIDNANGEVFIDIYKNNNMASYDNANYKEGTPTNKIISDLQYYFKNGEFPKQSELAQFRYSVSKNNQKWQQYLEKNYRNTGTGKTIKELKLPLKKDIITDEDYEVLNKIYEREGTTEVKTSSQVEQENKVAEVLGKLTNDKKTLGEQKDLLIQKFVNKGHAIDKIAKRTGNKNLTFKYDRMLGSQAEGQYEVGIAQTDNEGKEIGKSINDIWKPAEEAELVQEFSEYLLHKHNIDRVKQGKPIFGDSIDGSTSKAMVQNFEKLYPEFKKWSKDINTFYKNQMQNMVDAGLTTEETQQLLNDMYDNYIIVSRDKDSNYKELNFKITGTKLPIGKAQGGNANIQPLKDSIAKQAIAVKQAIRKNDLGLELLNTYKNAEDAEAYDINNVVSQDNKGAYFIVFQNGKAKRINITKELYDSLKPSKKHELEDNIFVKPIQKAAQLQRSLLTVDNPVFMITNFFKDFQDGMFNSKYTSKFIKNYGVALKEIKTQGKYYKEYVANGGSSNTYFDYEKGVKKETKARKFLEKIRTGNEIIEMAPRLAEFISTRQDGKSLDEALYNAAEITTNFKRGGDITKALNRNGANFLNASVQGLSKQIRNFSGQNGVKGYVNLLAKATALGVAPAILNHLLLGDDEEYQDLQDYVKDTYYLFKIGDNKFLRIPKGRALSIFGSAARRTLEYAQGNKEAFDGFKDTVMNQMAPNNPASDNIFAPLNQARTNTTWYGGDLVPTRLQDELPENQYDESTDKFSKWLGKLTGISPMKINYVIDQYSGGVGDILLPMLTPQAENNVLTDKFTVDSVLKNKNVSKFYEVLEEQTQISNAPEATDEDLLKTKYLNTVQASVSDLYKEKREVQLSDLTDKEKTAEVKRIQKEINDVLENGLNTYDKGKINSNYATIGDEQYYKDKDDEWIKVTKEEKEKNKNISLKTYADYKEKTYEAKEKLVKSGELTEKQSLKDKDKIAILTNSNYSDKEKEAIYENYILSSNDKTYEIMKKTGIDIGEYLEYKQQTFSSDKKEDGTIKGKTVSGSAKKKTYEYVNKMDITYNQKLLLLGMQYSLNNSEKTTLAKYINNMKISKEEKLDIYSKLSGFTVYKNGRVTW